MSSIILIFFLYKFNLGIKNIIGSTSKKFASFDKTSHEIKKRNADIPDILYQKCMNFINDNDIWQNYD